MLNTKCIPYIICEGARIEDYITEYMPLMPNCRPSLHHRCVSQFQWRRFNFFDKEVLKNTTDNQPFEKLKVRISFPNLRPGTGIQRLLYTMLKVNIFLR